MLLWSPSTLKTTTSMALFLLPCLYQTMLASISKVMRLTFALQVRLLHWRVIVPSTLKEAFQAAAVICGCLHHALSTVRSL